MRHMPDPLIEDIFSCRKCGRCCEGAGGIVLRAVDMGRLADFLRISLEKFREKYVSLRNGKLALHCGADGFCVFFKKDTGCMVHEAKPAVCRAWPFFRGNLVDPLGLAMAKDFCPGIAREINHERFLETGINWLKKEGLDAHAGEHGSTALIVQDLC